jgi:YVTN family beta-propeller protein
MKVKRDLTVDGLISTTALTVPNMRSLSGSTTETGSIVFDPETNTFYGKGNNSFVPVSNRVMTTFNVGVTPAGMAVSVDSRYAYVANNNNYSIANEDSVTVLDLINQLPLTTINHPSFIGPYTITINKSGTKAYVTNSTGSTITIINIPANTVAGLITGFDGPSGMVIKGTTGYVNNYGATTGIFTASISGTTMTVTNVAQGIISQGMAITTTGIFTASIAGTVMTVTTLISGAIGIGATITGTGVTPTTIASFGTGTGGVGTYNITLGQVVASTTITSTGAGGLVTTPGTIVTGYGTAVGGGVGTYTVNISQTVGSTTIGAVTPGLNSGNGHTVSVVDLNTNTITGSINVGLAPATLDITPSGDFVYVANYVDGNTNTATISKIRTSDNTVVTTIGPFSPNGFSGPFDIVINPDATKAYVTNFGSNNFFPYGTTVSVLDLSSNTIIDTIVVGIQPSGFAINSTATRGLVTNYNTLYTSAQFTNLVAGRGTVNVINLETNEVVAPTIAVDQSPSAIVITPDGTKVLVSNYTSNTVNMISI